MGRKAGKKAADPGGDFSDPVAVLRAFMSDMNAWEQRARAAVDVYQGTKEWEPKMRPFWEELARIFDRYCTPQRDRHGRRQYRPVGLAPTYDPEGEEILEVTSRPRGRAEIHTRRRDPRAFPREHVYFLRLEQEKWLLSGKKWLDSKGKRMTDYF